VSRNLTAIDVQRLAGNERCPFEIQDTFDDIADLADVPLTAVSPPKYHLGRLAAELLLRRLAEPDLPRHQVRLRPSIVVRDSCGAQKAMMS